MTEEKLGSRMERVQAAIRLENGDRNPVSLMMDYKFPCRFKGVTQGEYFRNRELEPSYSSMSLMNSVAGT